MADCTAQSGSGTHRKLVSQVNQTFTVSATNAECKGAGQPTYPDLDSERLVRRFLVYRASGDHAGQRWQGTYNTEKRTGWAWPVAMWQISVIRNAWSLHGHPFPLP